MHSRMRLPRAEATAIRDRIMKEMNALEEERMERMKGSEVGAMMGASTISGSSKSAEDEGIIRRELNKVDPSAVVFSESWAAKKVQRFMFMDDQRSFFFGLESHTARLSLWSPG